MSTTNFFASYLYRANVCWLSVTNAVTGLFIKCLQASYRNFVSALASRFLFTSAYVFKRNRAIFEFAATAWQFAQFKCIVSRSVVPWMISIYVSNISKLTLRHSLLQVRWNWSYHIKTICITTLMLRYVTQSLCRKFASEVCKLTFMHHCLTKPLEWTFECFPRNVCKLAFLLFTPLQTLHTSRRSAHNASVAVLWISGWERKEKKQKMMQPKKMQIY